MTKFSNLNKENAFQSPHAKKINTSPKENFSVFIIHNVKKINTSQQRKKYASMFHHVSFIKNISAGNNLHVLGLATVKSIISILVSKKKNAL